MIVSRDDTVLGLNPMTSETTPMFSVPDEINAIAYNVLDKLVYFWDVDTQQVGRVGANGDYELFTVPGMETGHTYLMGEVDPDGILWLSNSIGATLHWAMVDVSGATPVLVDEGSMTRPSNVRFTAGDWAYVPGHPGVLYTIAQSSGNQQVAMLVEFNMSTQTLRTVGRLGNLFSANVAMGGLYADADGFLYGADNHGAIIRVDVDAVYGQVIGETDPATTSDGTGCAAASAEYDFGDAPDSYDTLFSSNGPWHGLLNWDSKTDAAEVMLGATVTNEGDAEVTDKDDDDAFSAAPTTVVGQTKRVTVKVTNTSNADATLAGWFDVNGDGTFDSTEAIAPITVAPGASTVELTLPAADSTGTTWLRLRLYADDTTPSPVGVAAGGQVEDWAIVVEDAKPAMTLTKTGELSADENTATYTLTVTNTGNEAMTIVVSDPMLDATLTCPGGSATVELEPGESAVCTGSYTLTDADKAAGKITNLATATNTATKSGTLADPVTATVTLELSPEPTVSPTTTTGGSTSVNTGIPNSPGPNGWLLAGGIAAVAGSLFLAAKRLRGGQHQ